MISAAPSWSRTRLASFMISVSGRHSNTAPIGAARTRGGSSTSKRGIGSALAPNTSLPLSSSSTVRSCQPFSCRTAWWIGSTSKYSLARITAGPSGTSSMPSCQAMLRTPDSVAFCFSRSTGLISTR